MSKLLKKRCKKMSVVGYSALLLMAVNSQCVMAATAGGTTGTGIPQLDNILNGLKVLFLGVVAGIGLIVLIKAIGDTAQAYQEKDSHGIYDGVRGMVAGAIMVFAGALLGIFGL